MTSIESWLRLPLLEPDEQLVQRRAAGVRAYVPRIRKSDALDIVRMAQRVPSRTDGFEQRLSDAMNEGAEGSSRMGRLFELECFATACAHEALSRNSHVARIIGAAAASIAVSLPHPTQGILSLASRVETPRIPPPEGDQIELPDAPKDLKAKYEAALEQDEAAIGRAARPYVKALEAREKALAKAVKTATMQSSYWEDVWRSFAWLALGEGQDGSTYDNLDLHVAVVAAALDLANLVEDASLHLPAAAMLQLALRARVCQPVAIIDVHRALHPNHRTRIASVLDSSDGKDLAVFSQILVGPGESVPDVSRPAGSIAVTLFREHALLRALGKESD